MYYILNPRVIKNIKVNHFLEKEIIFTEDGWINATATAKTFGKENFENFVRSKAFTAYLEAFCKFYRTEKTEVIYIKQGGNPKEQGTFLHPYLAVKFARWISPDFEVWCDDVIRKILTNEWEEKYHELKQSYEEIEDKAFDLYELLRILQFPE